VGYSKHTSFPTFTLKALPPKSKQIEKEEVKEETKASWNNTN
jgi:hypothetical protein